MAMLEVNHLAIQFGGLRAVDGFNVSIEKGQLYGLIGPNGAGKTTIFNLLTGVYKPTEGIIKLDGQDITGKSTIEINKAGIARTFQNIRLFKDMPVLDNVKVGLHNHHSYSTLTGILRLPKYHKEEKEMNEKAMEILKVFDLDKEADTLAGNLPYGKQRKLEIARALATNPKLLIADEPTTALDVTIQAQILRIIKTLTKESNTSVLLITHDMGVVAEVADHVMVMYAGKSVEYGTAEDIFDHPKHPYTIGLLNSIPKLGSGQEEHLYTIEGTVPGLDEMPEGCRFCTRCQHATEQCRKKDPGMREVDGHMVRCFLYGKEGEN